MSNHLRHCPKHRKPLPWAQRALAKPATVKQHLPLPAKPLVAEAEMRRALEHLWRYEHQQSTVKAQSEVAA
jgi:hypothetical protein